MAWPTSPVLRRVGKEATLLLLIAWLASIAPPSAACPSACTCKWKGGKQTIECSNKGLVAVPEGMDVDTQVLDISSNTLQLLHRRLFQRLGLVNLQRVYLSRCRLGHLDELAFQGLTNLVELDLSDNMLTAVPVAALSELPALMRLSLARNPIHRLANNSFRSLKYMTTLELSHCQIEVVEEGAFDGLKQLEWLKLDGNALNHIGGSSVLPRSLHGVTLHDNPWACDCHLSQLRAWLVQFNTPLTMEPKCSAPLRLAARPVKSLDPIEFACPPEISPTSVTLEVLHGANISLQCRVTGDPEPRLAWWRNGQKITPQLLYNDSEVDSNIFYSFSAPNSDDDGAHRSELTIISVTDKENGTFVCTADNRAGSARSNFTITVLPTATVAPTATNIEYVFTVGGVVAAIVITLVVIVVAIAVRCCCCRRRRIIGHQPRDKTITNNLPTNQDVKDSKSKQQQHQTTSPTSLRPMQMSGMIPASMLINTSCNSSYNMNGGVGVAGGAIGRGEYQPSVSDTMDQSPDLISDTTTIKWKENTPVCLVDGSNSGYPLYNSQGSLVRLDCHNNANPYYSCSGPLSTISETVLHQHYYTPLMPAPSGAAGPQSTRTSACGPPMMPYPAAAGCPPEMTLLNPATYLDSDGFPIDYGLPRPSRPTRPSQSHVRFAEPPSSIRHYENYGLDQIQQDHFLADQKYPDAYGQIPSVEMETEIRYHQEDTSYPHFNDCCSPDFQQLISPPPEAYANPDQQHVIYSPRDKRAQASSSGLESCTAAALSPLSETAAADGSSTLQRQPHESPDEGYEDEGADGTEI